MTLKTRNEFPRLTSRYQLASLLPKEGGVGAEVGVALADFSFSILRAWPGTMILVDPWAILNDPGFSGHGEDTNEGQEARYQEVLREAKAFNGHALVMRATSEQAAPQFADRSLDLCYLDAQHDYPSIRRDLELWYPKVKSGGCFAGHDMLQGTFNGQEYGVKQAVEEFAAKNGLTVNVIPEEWPSFWIVKP